MSHPVDNDIEPGSINNYQAQHSSYSYPHPPPHQAQLPPQLLTTSQHQAQPPRPFQHGGHHLQQQQPQQQQQQHQHQHQHHHQQQQQQQHPYFGQVAPFTTVDNRINNHHQSSFPVISSFTRPAFHLDSNPSYAAANAVPSAVLVSQNPQGLAGATNTTTWAVRSETTPTISHQQQGGLIEEDATQGLTAIKSTTAANSAVPAQQQPEEMRYIRAPLDVLNAEQYDDGRFFSSSGRHGHELSKPEAHGQTTTTTVPSNPKKRRKTSQNDQAEPIEEPKRARGRPRLEGGDQKDLKARRKEQIRTAQRAYRSRKENAITNLEAEVARLKAGNAGASAVLDSLLGEYQHTIKTQMPELARGLQRLQAAIAQNCAPTDPTTSPGGDETTTLSPSADDTAMQTDQPPVANQQHIDDDAALTSSQVVLHQQQPQQLFGGIIVTHEPENQVTSRNSTSALGEVFEFDQLQDVGYTFIRMPHLGNASFRSPNQSYAELGDFSQSAPWPTSLDSQWGAPPLPASAAYMEGSLGRRLHRRMTERASRLLNMDNPPHEVMHRVFGFVRNYEPLDKIRRRIHDTLRRAGDEELNIYTQPFHRVGGAGVHFPVTADDIKAAATSGFHGNNGFGVGPYDERTMAVRDELLDILQHSKFPGWQGEWFDAYEVQQVLSRSAIALPQGGGSGIIELPADELFDKLSGDADSIFSASASPLMSTSLRSNSTTSRNGSGVLRSSSTSRNGTAIDISSNAIAMHHLPVEQQQQQQHAMALGNMQYPSPTSSVDSSNLSIPAMASDMWQTHPAAGSGFLTMSGHISPLLAYSHPHPHTHSHGHLDQHDVASLAFSSNASQLGYTHTPPTPIDIINSYTRTKKVWFNEDKFIESLGARGTCVGRGPAFRKKDIEKAFKEAVEVLNE